MKLEQYKTDMQNMKDLTEVNQALAEMAKVNNNLDIGSARSQFEAAKNAVERRNLRVSTQAELSENRTEKLNTDLEKMTLDDEVARRLQMLEETSYKQLPK